MSKQIASATAENGDNYHHGDLRNALIQTGLEILAEEDAASLSLRKVARRAGVSHAAPYRHFADKGALFAAIAQVGFQDLQQRVAALLAEFADRPDEIVAEAAWRYIEFSLDNPDKLRVMFSGIIRDLEMYPDLLASAMAALGALADCLAIAQAAGAIGSGDLQQGTLAAWSMMHGISVLMIEQKLPMLDCTDRGVAEPVARRMIDVFVQGLKEGIPT